VAEYNRKADSGTKTGSGTKKKPNDSKLSMVPLFSKRSIIVLFTGLVVGLLLGFAYWLASPLFTSLDDPENQAYEDNAAIIERLGIDTGGPYQSKVDVQIVDPEDVFPSMSALRQFAEYYAAVSNSSDFLEYLNQELVNYQLDTEYTLDDLSKMILSEYNEETETQAITVTVVAPTEEEAFFFADLVPQTFLDYLIYQEESDREQQYNDTLKEIETVKKALYEAHQKLDSLDSLDILYNPEYITLTAEIEMLQNEHDAQLDLLAMEYSGGSGLEEAYNDTLQKLQTVIGELIQAEQDLRALSQGSDTLNDPDTLFLEAKIVGLENQLNVLVTGSTETTGLTELITAGISAGSVYDNLMEKIAVTSQALSQARREYDEIVSSSTEQSGEMSQEYQLAQIKVNTLNDELVSLQEELASVHSQIIELSTGNIESTYRDTLEALNNAKAELEALEDEMGYDRLYNEIEYQTTLDIIDRLNSRVGTLNEQLGSLVGENVENTDTGFLVVGSPSSPTPLLMQRDRARDILLMGAILGVVVAWIALNFRWLWSKLSYQSASSDIDEEE
jgi:hypothetical protein